MEKLYKVVCANFAIANKHTGKCDTSLEDSVDEALMAFVGLVGDSEPQGAVSAFLGIDGTVLDDLYSRFLRKKSYRFKVKLGLIQNGMRL